MKYRKHIAPALILVLGMMTLHFIGKLDEKPPIENEYYAK